MNGMNGSVLIIERKGNDPLFRVTFKLSGDKDTFFEMLQSFKDTMPDRKYEPGSKVWTVPFQYQSVLLGWAATTAPQWFDACYADGQKLWGSGPQQGPTGNTKSQKQKANSGKSKAGPSNFEDFGDFSGGNGSKGNGSNGNGKASTYAQLYLTPDAPPELVTRVWKILMTMNHPDKGGDTERCAQINQAYQELKAIGAVQ